GGDVAIRMEYYEAEMFASARLDWVEIDAENGGWMIEYWDNQNLEGLPAAVDSADELPIDVDWGYSAPVAELGADHFSVRWYRDITFTPGRHRFTVRSDDGVRLWVNNRLVIDRWSAHAPTTYYADVYLTGGTVPVRMEYFEDEVTAEAELRWDFLSWSDESLSHGTVRSESLNIRRGPSTAYRVIENISRGTEVELAGFVSEDGQWVLVTLPGHGVRGWAYAGLLNRNVSLDRLSVWGGNDATVMVGANSATVTAYSRLNVRQGPGLSHDVLTSVPRGMKLEMAGYRSVDNRWLLVTLPDSGLRGWVYAPLTTTSVSVSSLAAWAPGTSGTVTAYYLNLRSGPGVEHSILTFLARGEEVTLLERDEECCWVRVVSEGGQIGWVTASYLDASVALTDLPAAH
ncbi:MAG: SH3 domain-containing protein, partial [Candidatus Promineifilaceae bacterium]|nr:SH3 domain-containing protein [Candidatus Promineifilaceae bacterium]